MGRGWRTKSTQIRIDLSVPRHETQQGRLAMKPKSWMFLVAGFAILIVIGIVTS